MSCPKFLFVPAFEIRPVDELENTRTLARLRTALFLWRQGDHERIIVCGGRYLPPAVQQTPAAELMREWLILQGVPEDKILVEAHSTTTRESVSFALGLVQRVEYSLPVSFTIVSDHPNAVCVWLSLRLGYGQHANIHVVEYPAAYAISSEENAAAWRNALRHIMDPRGVGKAAVELARLRREIAAQYP